MVLRIFPIDDDETYLDPKDLVSILEKSLPTVTVDWEGGDKLVQSTLDQLVALEAQAVVIRSHKRLFGETAVVEAAYPEFPGKKVGFVVQFGSCIQLESD